MTLIIGIEDPENNRVVLASDSGVWNDRRGTTLRMPKLWRSGAWVLGASGTVGGLQFLQRGWLDGPTPPFGGPHPCYNDPPTFEEAEQRVSAWAISLVQPFATHNQAIRAGDPDSRAETPAILAALGPWIWKVQDGSATSTTDGFAAVGYWEFAVGALATLELLGSKAEPPGRLVTALKVVHRLGSYCTPPYRWLDTQGGEGTFE